MWSWITSHYQLIATIALGVIELASLIPGVAASGYIKFAMLVLRWFSPKDPMPPDQGIDSTNVPIDPHK